MLIGREKEFQQIESLLLDTLKNQSKTSHSIYISGAPGTGKTATVKAVIQKLQKQRRKFHFVSVDCFASYTSSSLSNEILTKLNADVSVTANKMARQLEEKFETTKKPIIILLDEIDNLLSHKDKIIYSAFNWPTKHPGRVSVIGISNSLDLTERILPKHKFVESPHLIVFAAYTSAQLISILEARLANENIEQKAIELCARKVASTTGDIRRALDIASQMLANMEEDDNDQLQLMSEKENIDPREQIGMTTPQKMPAKTLKRAHPDDMGEITPKKSACREVLNAINKVATSPCQRSKLPLHPRILLATLMRLISSSSTVISTSVFRTPSKTPPRTPVRTPNGKSADDSLPNSLSVTRDILFQAYLKVCERLQMKPLEPEELNNVYEVLESQAIIKLTGGGGGQPRVFFMVEMALARQTINDNALFTTIDELEL